MAETLKTMIWCAPAVENKNDGIATMTQGNPDLLPEEVNWDFVDFLSSQEFVPEPVPLPLSPSVHITDGKATLFMTHVSLPQGTGCKRFYWSTTFATPKQASFELTILKIRCV
jgi:hypothetical protein